VGPWLTHTIDITPVTRNSDNPSLVTSRGKKMTRNVFRGGPDWARESSSPGGDAGEEWWTTYRYQLEVFIRKIRKGNSYRGPDVRLDESVRVAEMIDAVYEKAGLPVRNA
jgi:hypothetical protein